ncbi:MAG: hypothetical protein ACFFD4_36565 [Candidatus Odinarchaeota archaeon]
MSYPSDQFYHSKWKSIVNVLKSSNLSVSRIAQAGSRARRQHEPASDMDVIFAVARNPSRQSFYPELIEVLKSNFPYETVYPGTNYNVVHLDFNSGGKFELVLLTEQDFDRQHRHNVEYKRDNL